VKKGARHPFDTIVALELDSDSALIPAVSVPGAVSLALRAKATASNTFQGKSEFAPAKAVDGDGETRWATDTDTESAWLEVDLGKPQLIGKARIHQPYPELRRIKKYSIEYWDDGKWTTCHQGTDPGEKTTARFAPTTAQRVRLNLTECSDGPTVWEFGLFPPDNQAPSTK
jgi:alpha-L-fucosidase